jgi:uncharacterized delta-60 repeat protein
LLWQEVHRTSTSATAPLSRVVGFWFLAAIVSAIVISGASAAAGDLDPTFGGDGKVTTRFKAGTNYVGGVAIQSDGKVVVAGFVVGRRDEERVALARYNRNGTLDDSFGGDGRVTTPPGAEARAVAIQDDGKIVIVGPGGRRGFFAIVRYRPNGSLDPTFSGDGKAFADFVGRTEFALGVALQTNGKIVAAGTARRSSRFALARFTPSGTLDTTFGGDGKVTTNFTTYDDSAYDVAIQSDGKIVAAGGAAIFGGSGAESSFALARYNTNGTLDVSFDTDGKLTTDLAGIREQANGIAIQADGKIVAAGTSGQTGEPDFSPDSKFTLIRYKTDGSVDTSFDGDGVITTNFATDFQDGANAGVAIQADEKIVAAGDVGNRRFALARYEGNGALDATFGSNGTVETDFGIHNDAPAGGVAIQANGKIVVAGSMGASGEWFGHYKFAVARYLAG